MSERMDPAMKAAFESLSADLQLAVTNREDRGERALRSAYLRERAHRNPFPNRAARRAAKRRGASR